MKPVDFEYEAPRSVEEALRLLEGRGAQVKILAGGQSLVPLLVTRALRPLLVMDIGRIPGLGYVRLDGEWLRMGATATQSACAESPLVRGACPLLASAIGWVATPQVRSLGTVVGSLAQRNAISEIPTVAAALGARLTVAGPGGRRDVAAADFLDPASAATLRPDEIVLEARFPRQPPGAAWDFLEVQRRHAHYSLVGAAVSFRLDEAGAMRDARVALGGVSSHARRFPSVETALEGRPPAGGVFSAASALAPGDPGMNPADDGNATAAYRRAVAPVIVRRALGRAHARLMAGPS